MDIRCQGRRVRLLVQTTAREVCPGYVLHLVIVQFGQDVTGYMASKLYAAFENKYYKMHFAFSRVEDSCTLLVACCVRLTLLTTFHSSE